MVLLGPGVLGGPDPPPQPLEGAGVGGRLMLDGAAGDLSLMRWLRVSSNIGAGLGGVFEVFLPAPRHTLIGQYYPCATDCNSSSNHKLY